jgi:hypothetical protein
MAHEIIFIDQCAEFEISCWDRAGACCIQFTTLKMVPLFTSPSSRISHEKSCFHFTPFFFSSLSLIRKLINLMGRTHFLLTWKSVYDIISWPVINNNQSKSKQIRSFFGVNWQHKNKPPNNQFAPMCYCDMYKFFLFPFTFFDIKV